MKAVFFGNHTVGIEALSVLLEKVEVAAVVAHPSDPEDGVRYESVFKFSQDRGLNVIRGKATEESVKRFVIDAEPDLIWVTDYRYLLPKPIIKLPTCGTINLHPSLLPLYRGRAPINWAIIHGEQELGLTAHYIDEGVDTGNIIEQERFELFPDEDVGDALNKLMPLYSSVTSSVLDKVTSGAITSRVQGSATAAPFPARRPADGQIDWNHPATSVLNLIRAVASPYPGAFTFVSGKKILVWKASVIDRVTGEKPGTVIGYDQNAPVVACGQGAVALRRYEYNEPEAAPISPGDVFVSGAQE